MPRINRSEDKSPSLLVEGDSTWVIESLPFVALERIVFHDGHEAVEHLLTIRPDYRKFLDFSSMHACMFTTYLVDFLSTHHLLKQTERNFVFPISEWNNLDYLLGWVQTNAIPCLDALPELIADEAVYIIQHKSRYFDYYKMFFKRNASIEELRLRIEKDEELELKLKTLAEEQRKLKAQIDAQAGPRSHSKHKNKKGSFNSSCLFRGF
ncbi:hypothetical protein DER46DRAFT_665177 [Fusarium sp. MPI-SDFR-AT-0072]|nr:hypothetical protein DER46DRAFT_665177 [Fusarium sp. MPI-SDFR-AT-0072]